MDDSLEKLNGKPVRILFRNSSNFYTVMLFRTSDEEDRTLTVTGICPSIQTDVMYNIYGRYVEHPRYGIQFALEHYEVSLPSEEEGVIRFLSGPSFPGIGKKTAASIVEALGPDCLEEIRRNPEILHLKTNLNDKQISAIESGMSQSDEGLSELSRFLNVYGIGSRSIIRLNQAYGKEALQVLKNNPYQAAEECDGFGFATADKIAAYLGFAQNDDRRLEALLIALTMDLCVRSGDSYVDSDDLEQAFAKQTKGFDADYPKYLDAAVARHKLVNADGHIYPITQYEAETGITNFLNHFPLENIDPADPHTVETYLQSIQDNFGIEYDAVQKEAILSILDHLVQIVTGGPGTGKTTVVRAMVKLFHLLYPDAAIVCAAPTGRAAKRLSELTGTPAATIHSLLQWDLDSNTFGKDEDDPIQADLLVIDEFSMVDAWLFYHLLKASAHVKRLCIIGDEDQLPSVGPGCVLRDLIASGRFPLLRLDHIYRQKEGSDVIALAHQIKTGHPDFSSLQHDIVFYPCRDEEIKDNVLAVVRNALEKNYTVNDIQVLSPMYKGAAGISTLNNALQMELNPYAPEKKELRHGYQIFRVGDKILQLKNQPDDNVYNGDIGILTDILDAKQVESHRTTVVVSFGDHEVEYSEESLDHITLAYCISVHKAQGSEYPIVILPISRQHQFMLQRKLIYTAVTRARRSLVILGDEDAFMKGAATLEYDPRKTGLAQRLKNDETSDDNPFFTDGEGDDPFADEDIAQ
ncbi:MAG: ATP-dependent RecD-like DNA helicase [Lactimicrobium massiliense]|nr:ATP-dependent RecD-like DNA helicase [Lactimicrobium massiliense]MDD6230546.1 ATP-dependent RecD-like DNA helicase [Lactimicrobium massiliense]